MRSWRGGLRAPGDMAATAGIVMGLVAALARSWWRVTSGVGQRGAYHRKRSDVAESGLLTRSGAPSAWLKYGDFSSTPLFPALWWLCSAALPSAGLPPPSARARGHGAGQGQRIAWRAAPHHVCGSVVGRKAKSMDQLSPAAKYGRKPKRKCGNGGNMGQRRRKEDERKKLTAAIGWRRGASRCGMVMRYSSGALD